MWECPICGKGRHVYGIEEFGTPDAHKNRCPKMPGLRRAALISLGSRRKEAGILVAKTCPQTGEKTLYIDCLECEDRAKCRTSASREDGKDKSQDSIKQSDK